MILTLFPPGDESLSSSQLNFFTVLGMEPGGQTLFWRVPPSLCCDGNCGGEGAAAFFGLAVFDRRPFVLRAIIPEIFFIIDIL